MKRHTHTYVCLPLSKAAYEEIAKKLHEAGYEHCFSANGEIDMNGLAVELEDGQ